MRLAAAAILAITLLAAVGCTTNGDESSHPGNPAVYERIASLTDCAALQREFDTAMDNSEARPALDPAGEISQSYGEAANDRMRSIGCYG